MLLKKELLTEFIRENNLTTARDIQNALKDVFASTLQEILEAELDLAVPRDRDGEFEPKAVKKIG